MRPRVLEEAEAELISAMLYYEDRREGLAEDFFNCVADRIEAIGKEPLRFPIYEGRRLRRTYRRAIVERFSYIVVYEVRDDEILVVAIAHSSQRPGYWEHRGEY